MNLRELQFRFRVGGRRRPLLPFFTGLLLAVGTSVGMAQVPVGPGHEEFGRHAAAPRALTQLAEAGNWQGVIDYFDRLDTRTPANARLFDNPECGYYRARALFMIGAPGARAVLEDYARCHPASPAYATVVMMVGDCCFLDGDYAAALLWYSEIDPAKATLSTRDRDLFTYRLAVSRLMNGLADPTTADLLERLSDTPGYELPARYYKAYYAYLNRDYDKAYRGFEKVAQELADTGADAEGMAPQYYMVQILYRNGRYDEVINHGRSLMRKNRVEQLVPELNRVVGLSYFKKGDTASARGLLDSYVDHAERNGYTPASDAVYALGVCEYDAGDTELAAKHFTSLTDLQDMTGQGAWYHLGEIAMTRGRYDEAVIDFRKASRMAYDGDTAERAAYNCIAAVTHGGRSPFQSTTAMYEDFLDEWPESRYADNVRRGLYQAYAAQSDYDNALQILRAIKHPDAGVTAELQKLLYAKGTRLERAGRHKEAAEALREAVSIGADRKVTAESSLWLGDALYGAGDYAGSVRSFDKALASKSDITGERRAAALYQRGYSNMRRERYADAARDFAEVLKMGKASRELTNDARLRLADCQYYSGNLSGAAETYREVRDLDSDEGDYATLRLALLAGLQGDRPAETAMLRDFIKNSPDSPARPEAMSKLASSLEAQGKQRDAVIVLDDLLRQYPGSTFSRGGALKSADLTRELGDRDAAVAKYRDVIERWPSSDEAVAADKVLRDHYASLGELDAYASFLASVQGAPKIKASEMEEITFRAAERAYVADPTDITALETYVARYPGGQHVPSALLWIANASFDAGRSREALAAADRILTDYPASAEAEDARLLKEDLNEYSELFEAVELADSSRQQKKGLEALRRLASNPDSPVGAQANVELAERLLKAGRNKEALELLEDFTASGTPQQYWLARGFLTLADLYHSEGKDWLAREYVISLRDNYPGSEADIKSGISDRLNRYKGEGSQTTTSTNRKSRKRK